MASANKSITARIDWCRWLSTQACAPLEIAEWRAEAEGLDAHALSLTLRLDRK